MVVSSGDRFAFPATARGGRKGVRVVKTYGLAWSVGLQYNGPQTVFLLELFPIDEEKGHAMRRAILALMTAACVLHAGCSGESEKSADGPSGKSDRTKGAALSVPTQEEAIKAIKAKGGHVIQSKQGGSEIRVSLASPFVTDADLVNLRALPALRYLDIYDSKITDSGLDHIKGLTGLKHLGLARNRITDAGLARLAGLTKLEKLELFESGVTDGALVHLKGMTELQILNLQCPQITGAGFAHL